MSGGVPGREAPVAQALTGAGASLALTWTPSAAFLNDPAVTYPVTIDPVFSGNPATDPMVRSGATTVSVIFNRDKDSVQIIVEDTGRGFDVESLAGNHAHNRFGLLGMRERATLAGGTFDVESTPGKGTSLFVRVPIS